MEQEYFGTTLRYEDGATITFAVEELLRYVKQGNVKFAFDIISLGISDEFFRKKNLLKSELQYDGYLMKCVGGELILASCLPRGILFAVYTLLEENGCRFIKAAGIREKAIFYGATVKYVGCRIYNPDFEVRSMTNCIGNMTEQVYGETLEIVDWCAKNRINTFFLHEGVDQPYNEWNRRLSQEICKRGILYEFGGHGAQNFVSRELFDKEPELFIEKNGKREKTGNFCVSQERAKNLFVDSVRKLMRQDPYISVLHLWFDDVLDGSWCECEQCRELSPLNQIKRMVEYAGQKLKSEYPLLKFDILFYHDTIVGEDALKSISENCVIYWAPRERCYAHSIRAENCRLNGIYGKLLEQAVADFGSENICLFEYYMDFILFSKVKTNFAETIAEDLRYYQSLGLKKCTVLGFGYYSFWAHELNNFVYAKHLFCTELNVKETVRSFLADMELPERFEEYYDLIAEFSKNYFAFCGYGLEFCDIRRVTLCDYTKDHLEKIKSAREFLMQAREFLEKEKLEEKFSQFIKYQKMLLDISLLEVDGIVKRTELRYRNFVKRMNPAELVNADDAKRCQIKQIDLMDQVPFAIKGSNGGDAFIKNLCRTQIWTVNEFLVQEFGMKIDLDMSKILEGEYDVACS